MGKPLAVGLKYGLFKPKDTLWYGIKSCRQSCNHSTIIHSISDSGLQTGARKLRDLSMYTTEKIINPILTRNLKFEQLPKFEDWRLFSVADADPLKRRLKKLDNFLAAFRSVGKKLV